jgi:hypothetical protein
MVVVQRKSCRKRRDLIRITLLKFVLLRLQSDTRIDGV